MFVEVFRRPVLDVGLRGGLPQGEFWENATAGARHHIPRISTGLKLGTSSEVLRLTGEQRMEKRGRRGQSSLCCRTLRVRAESFFKTQREQTGIKTDALIQQYPQGFFSATKSPFVSQGLVLNTDLNNVSKKTNKKKKAVNITTKRLFHRVHVSASAVKLILKEKNQPVKSEPLNSPVSSLTDHSFSPAVHLTNTLRNRSE